MEQVRTAGKLDLAEESEISFRGRYDDNAAKQKAAFPSSHAVDDGRDLLKILNDIYEPALWFCGLIAAWEFLVWYFDVRSFILPAPSDFLVRIVQEHQRFIAEGLQTTKLIIYGFVAGVLPGLILGYLTATVRILEKSLYPVVVFFQSLPKVTLAPLMLVWFGFGDISKILLVALVAFFPILVDSAAGFKSIDERQYYIGRSMGASWWQKFRFIQFPAALPNIFSGFKITIIISVTMVIVTEWLNSTNGLGYIILRAMDSSDMSLIFATLFVASTIGVFLNYAVVLLEKKIIPWHAAKNQK